MKKKEVTQLEKAWQRFTDRIAKVRQKSVTNFGKLDQTESETKQAELLAKIKKSN